MAPTLEKYRLLSEDESESVTLKSSSSSEELTGHEYLSRTEVSTYKFSKLSIIITAFLFVASIVSNIAMALTLRKVWVPTQRITKLGEYLAM
jgi:hypothetical protein